MQKKISKLPFKGTPEQEAQLKAVIAEYCNDKSNVMVVMQKAQDIYGYLPIEVQTCLGTACYVKGSGAVLEKLKEKLGIDVGECTADEKFSLEACRCIGACGLAPVLTVNDEVYGRLVPDDVDKILAKYAD